MPTPDTNKHPDSLPTSDSKSLNIQSLVGRTFNNLLKVILLTVILLAILFSVSYFTTQASIKNNPTTIITGFCKRMQLLQQELPAENSLPNPLTGQHLTDTWEVVGRKGRAHEGIDIFAPRDTPIKSTTAGIVTRIGYDGYSGDGVVIYGPGGAGHFYANLESFADISLNDWVEAGEVIGYVGDSNNNWLFDDISRNDIRKPPHLNYSIYINGSKVNPYPLLIKP